MSDDIYSNVVPLREEIKIPPEVPIPNNVAQKFIQTMQKDYVAEKMCAMRAVIKQRDRIDLGLTLAYKDGIAEKPSNSIICEISKFLMRRTEDELLQMAFLSSRNNWSENPSLYQSLSNVLHRLTLGNKN